jgi:hypothetical protein
MNNDSEDENYQKMVFEEDELEALLDEVEK